MKYFISHYKSGDRVHWVCFQSGSMPSQVEIQKAIGTTQRIDMQEVTKQKYDDFMAMSKSRQEDIIKKMFYSNVVVIDLKNPWKWDWPE